MSNTWKPDTFKPQDIKTNLDNRTFIVPRFQRGIVWNNQQRLDLVDTIKKGLPFGSLLLYKDSNSTYQIIDGLQRSTAIKEFVKNPAQFFNEDDIDDHIIAQIARLLGVTGNLTIIEEEIRNHLKQWVSTHDTLEKVEGMQFPRFGQVLAREFPTARGKEFEIGDLVTPMLQDFQKICKRINDTDIPAIILYGDSDQLPILFERINSRGTPLSKYQIYAASWSMDQYSISDSFIDLVKANRDRYDLMLGGDATLDDYDPIEFLNSMKLNAFEIAFGIGKYLSKNWPHLFGESKKETQVESIGFTLLNCCLGKKNKDVGQLNGALEQIVGKENINLFLLKIDEAVKFVDKRIGKYNSFKSNSRPDSGKRPLHTEFQIVSIIASVFLSKYADIEYDENDAVTKFELHLGSVNDKWRRYIERDIKRNLGKIYIMEILQHRWMGSGDKKMDSIISNPEYYAREVSYDEFLQNAKNWYVTLNAERPEYKKIATAKEPELVMIAAIYLRLFSADNQMNDSKYDIEHLATKALMKQRLEQYGGQLKLPISSFGNLCLLPQYENRSKGKKTIYQDGEYLRKSNITIDYIEENYSFTKKTDLEWIEKDNLSMEEFKEAYMTFINNRFEKIMDIIRSSFNSL